MALEETRLKRAAHKSTRSAATEANHAKLTTLVVDVKEAVVNMLSAQAVIK
jgi:hypothetical protein